MSSDSINSGLRIRDFKILCLLFMDRYTKTPVHCPYVPVEIINIPPKSGLKIFKSFTKRYLIIKKNHNHVCGFQLKFEIRYVTCYVRLHF